jgi:type I restriction enzyme M protein
MKKDGFSLDQKREFIDGKGDIPDLLKKFKTRVDSEQSFKVDIDLIKENEYSLDINRYKKVENKEIKHDKPTKIIDNIIQEEEAILKELNELKSIVK